MSAYKENKACPQLGSCYKYFGFHAEGGSAVFRVCAPRAREVFLVGDFCDWSSGIPMERLGENGAWECRLPIDRVSVGDKYKYKIVSEQGCFLKADPYATCAEAAPDTASVVYDISGYAWRDASWLEYRRQNAGRAYLEPMNIYQLELGSWKRRENGERMSYAELLSELAPYVKQMGYTHIELMPLLECSDASSLGFVTSSFFAPRASYGTPSELMSFIDGMHEAGVGVILELPIGRFATDAHGLIRFDGQPLYERAGESEAWSTVRVDTSRRETQELLISVCKHWIDNYHVDGLVLCGVADMLSEWDRLSLESAGNLLRQLTQSVKRDYPDVMLVAGETLSDDEGAYARLGFDVERSTRYAESVIEYSEIDPIFRKHDHEKMTLSLMHTASQKYVLPLYHGEQTGGRGSLISRAYGDYWQRFASVRALLGYTMTYPGKKLTFMGTEIGQFDEWDAKEPLQWFLLDYDAHAKLQRYVSELGQLYLKTPELWELDITSEGFSWIDAGNREQSIISFSRMDNDGNAVVVLANFTPVTYEAFRTGVPYKGEYREIFNSDDERYGGSGAINPSSIKSESKPWNWLENSIVLRIPPMAVTILKCVRRTPTKQKTKTPSVIKRKIIKK